MADNEKARKKALERAFACARELINDAGVTADLAAAEVAHLRRIAACALAVIGWYPTYGHPYMAALKDAITESNEETENRGKENLGG